MSAKQASPLLRLGLPKGTLQATTQKLLGLAGFDVRYYNYLPKF